MCDGWSGRWGARLLPVCSALHTALPGPITEQPAVAQCSGVPTRTCELLRDGGHSTAVRPGPAGPNAAQTAAARLALIGFLLGTASLSTGKGSDRILIPGAPPGTLRGPPSLTREILLRSPSRVGERDPRQYLAGHRLSWSSKLSHWGRGTPRGQESSVTPVLAPWPLHSWEGADGPRGDAVVFTEALRMDRVTHPHSCSPYSWAGRNPAAAVCRHCPTAGVTERWPPPSLGTSPEEPLSVTLTHARWPWRPRLTGCSPPTVAVCGSAAPQRWRSAGCPWSSPSGWAGPRSPRAGTGAGTPPGTSCGSACPRWRTPAG